ncbi:fumarylacetoacetate hydrolase family protein [Arthrobacter mobilis]|uniref:Fumarylacetoacetate hydrolase family protein n=1 Tax=Arthrobacter mobilis TaxID=2724944 RepID=A0A7X6K7F9_9MICC|nr:fumarylacetoacetate hydrolase family protein [Arthrobacter mobilis]NKX56519.1 fumarylacetoacetate hydrolase family protein [Arthrobacter mobilis]
MRLANISDRLSLVTADDELIDIAQETGGRFSPRIQDCYDRWDELLEVAATLDGTAGRPLADVALHEFGNPAPQPRQVFAIGLNYADHAAEASLPVPEDLTVFTKFATSLAGPYGTIPLPPGTVDWEVELVAIIGRGGRHIPADRAWSYVAGVSVGQDLSERTLQAAGPAPQYSLAKSFPGFGPIGPLLATPDEFEDPDNIELGCSINGEQVQKGSTSDMVFPVPEIIARLSRITPLLPGDVIFTGTPPGVGVGRTPQRFLTPGDELVTYLRGVGEMRHRIQAMEQQ